MATPRILSVGQCRMDHGSISRHLRQAFNAETTAADTADKALDALRSGPFDLVLINRVGDRDGLPGADLIRAIRADPALAETPLMLVSDRPDAQREAETLGARPGFGKSNLRTEDARERLAAVLEPAD